MHPHNQDDKKGVTKKPLDIEVRLYKTSDILDAGVISNPINQKDYGDIVTNSLIQGYRLAEQTKIPGEYIYRSIPKDDYIVIGYADRVTDYKHLGTTIVSGDKNWGNGEILVKLKLQTGKTKKEKKEKKNKKKK